MLFLTGTSTEKHVIFERLYLNATGNIHQYINQYDSLSVSVVTILSYNIITYLCGVFFSYFDFTEMGKREEFSDVLVYVTSTSLRHQQQHMNHVFSIYDLTR